MELAHNGSLTGLGQAAEALAPGSECAASRGGSDPGWRDKPGLFIGRRPARGERTPRRREGALRGRSEKGPSVSAEDKPVRGVSGACSVPALMPQACWEGPRIIRWRTGGRL